MEHVQTSIIRQDRAVFGEITLRNIIPNTLPTELIYCINASTWCRVRHPLIFRKIIESKGLNWLNWRLTVLSYHKSRDRNDLGPFLFWLRFYLFSQFTRSEFWIKRIKHPREIHVINYFIMKSVLFLFSIGLCLTIPRVKRLEVRKLMIDQL